MIAVLAPFLGKSPRAVKRFMNIYRLTRGLRRGDALDRFLAGRDGQPALFPAVQFWLALDIGLKPEEVEDYRVALTGLDAAGLSLTMLASALVDEKDAKLLTQNKDFGAAAAKAVTSIQSWTEPAVVDGCAAAVRAIAERFPPDGVRPLLATEVEMRRFSLCRP
jgi:hypothetical protein